MALFDKADLVRRVKVRLNRPSPDEMMTVSSTDDVIYDALTEAQFDVVLHLASRVPDAVMTVPTQLTAGSENKTYTFGDDADTESIIALGHYRLYDLRENIPDYPLIEGVDYTVEGSLVRIPGNVGRTFDGSGGPWGQWVNPPGTISSSNEPTVSKVARLPVISGACAKIAANRLKQDPSEYLAQYEAELAEAVTALTTRSFMRGGNPMSARNYRMRYRWGLGR